MTKLPLCIAVGLLLGSAHVIGSAFAAEPKMSPDQTAQYVQDDYKTAAGDPALHVSIEYRPPLLYATWQEERRIAGNNGFVIENKQVKIDLRYAKFSVWNDGWSNHNLIVVKCEKQDSCYSDLVHHHSYDYGVINYQVLDRVRTRLAHALNYLASFHVDQQAKDFFDQPQAAEEAKSTNRSAAGSQAPSGAETP